MARISFRSACALSTGLLASSAAFAQIKGPSTLQTPYALPSDPNSGVITISIASNGNGTLTPDELYNNLWTGVPNSYRLAGIPDGMGAFRSADDVAAGTFTLLCNHEIGAGEGAVRLHGNTGAFVSLWQISADVYNMTVLGGRDQSDKYYLWNTTTDDWDIYTASNPMPTGIGRYCSADLPPVSAFYYNGLGTQERIFMNGEEIGANGRPFAHVITGPQANTSWEVAWLGDFSWENSVASPFPQELTIVAGLDDSTPGGVYIYVGTKTNTGNEVDKAGLTNGDLYGIQIAGVTVNGSGQPVEDPVNGIGNASSGPVFSKPFALYNFGDASEISGAQLQSVGDANNCINWLRPEDGAWSTIDPNVFYFVTTATFSTNSRIWELRFNDITNPLAGGVATMLGQGLQQASFAGGFFNVPQTAPVVTVNDARMFDNLNFTPYNQLLIQEDVGSDARLGRIWLYDIDADSLKEVAISDPNRYQVGVAPSQFQTTNEETSGLTDACGVLGSGWYLTNMQGHYGIPGELVEGGQLMALYVPEAACPGDMDCDRDVDDADLGLLLASFGLQAGDASWYPPAGNLAGPTGEVTDADLGILLAGFGVPCN